MEANIYYYNLRNYTFYNSFRWVKGSVKRMKQICNFFLSFIPFHAPVFPYPSALAGGRVYPHIFCNIANGYFSITGH